MNVITKHDPQGQGMAQTLCYLQLALDHRIAWDNLIHHALITYGEGDYQDISGILRSHFPNDVKDELREHAHKIGYCTSVAADWWKRGGRRLHTFYPLSRAYRTLPDGRVSYY